jgi:hypothetical protein
MLKPMKVAMAGMAALCLFACSSSSSPADTHTDGGTTPGTDGGGGGGGSMSLSDFCSALLTAEATTASKCFGGSVTLWEEAEQGGSGDTCAALSTALAAGRITYDADGAGACLSAFQALSCSALTAATITPPACTSTLSGTAKTGAACLGDTDCAGTSDYCKSDGTACGGTCAAYVALGAACDPTGASQCVPDATCASTNGTTGKCTKTPPTSLAAKGAKCGLSGESFVTCQSGLACNATTNVCVDPVAEGDACTAGDNVCAPFTYCDATTKKCAPDATAAGDACGQLTGQAEYDECLGALYCKTATGSEAGVCAVLGATGAACTATDSCVGTCTIKAGKTTGTCAAACADL